jgi:hypothetical protein
MILKTYRFWMCEDGTEGWRLEQTGTLYIDLELYNRQQLASKLDSVMAHHLYEVPFSPLHISATPKTILQIVSHNIH